MYIWTFCSEQHERKCMHVKVDLIASRCDNNGEYQAPIMFHVVEDSSIGRRCGVLNALISLNFIEL